MENFDDIIAKALAGVNPQLGVQPPPLNTGQAMLPQNLISEAVTRALNPGGATVTSDDKSTAMAKIGISLMQPRMPGQSVAGNIGKSLESGSDYLDQAKARAQTTATQQAQTAIQAQTADTQNRVLNAKLQEMAVKFPMEVAEIQQRLRKAALEGKTEEYNTIVAALKSNPDYVVEMVKNDLANKQATTRNIESTADFHDAYAAYLDRGGKDKLVPGQKSILHSTKTDDGGMITSYMNGQEGPFYEIVRPGTSDLQTAMKIAEKELKKENQYGWFGGPTPEQIKQRAQELMKPKVFTIDSKGQTVQPKAAAPTSSTGQPSVPSSSGEPEQQQTGPTSSQSRGAAVESVGTFVGDKRRLNDQDQLELLKTQLTDPDRDHGGDEAVNKEIRTIEARIKKGAEGKATPGGGGGKKVETWTPERVNELLGAKGSQTPSGERAADQIPPPPLPMSPRNTAYMQWKTKYGDAYDALSGVEQRRLVIQTRTKMREESKRNGEGSQGP